MATDAGGNDGSTLARSFTGNETGGSLGTGIVEVADGFVGQQEAEWLAERTDDGNALLLTDRQLSHGGVAFLGDVELFKP